MNAEAICFGEILWDILPKEKIPGGAPMNVCYHLNRLKQDASIISKIGNDDNGEALIHFLQQNNIDCSLIQTDTVHPTGTVIAKQTGNEMEYDIIKPVAWDFIDHSKDLLERVSAASCFICGSLAARSKQSKNTLFQLLDVAQTKVVDINLRPPHYEQEIIEQLFERADILKLNNHELSLLAAWYTNEKDFKQQMAFISKEFSVPVIIVTKGENGATVYCHDKFFNNNGYKVKVADTIGSGDAFLAGFLAKYSNDGSPEAALDFACRLGAFVASQKGACPVYEVEEIESLSDDSQG